MLRTGPATSPTRPATHFRRPLLVADLIGDDQAVFANVRRPRPTHRKLPWPPALTRSIEPSATFPAAAPARPRTNSPSALLGCFTNASSILSSLAERRNACRRRCVSRLSIDARTEQCGRHGKPSARTSRFRDRHIGSDDQRGPHPVSDGHHANRQWNRDRRRCYGCERHARQYSTPGPKNWPPTITSAIGNRSIYTDSGVTLFQGGVARSVTFAPTTTYTAGTTGNAVYVDGAPIIGALATMPTESGTLAGLATLRENTSITYQAQRDGIAGALIPSFAESDQTGPGPNLPGLFTTPGATSLPTSTTGLASQIAVNATVDPSQGGNPFLLRDGGISDTSNSDYTYNTTGNASYSGGLSQLLTNLSATQTFNSAGGITTSATLSNYASDSSAGSRLSVQMFRHRVPIKALCSTPQRQHCPMRPVSISTIKCPKCLISKTLTQQLRSCFRQSTTCSAPF